MWYYVSHLRQARSLAELRLKIAYTILILICFTEIKSQTIKSNIPKYDSVGWHEYSYVLNSQSRLRLQPLDQNNSETIFRIWQFSNAISNVIEFSKNDLSWKVVEFDFVVRFNNKFIFSNINKLQPYINSNIDSLILKVTNLGIDTLSAQDNVKIDDVFVDGSLYCFEFKNKNNLNFYYYNNPNELKERYSQARLASLILQELDLVRKK